MFKKFKRKFLKFIVRVFIKESVESKARRKEFEFISINKYGQASFDMVSYLKSEKGRKLLERMSSKT